jgi:SAM-dependent methyltransferase
MPTRCDAGTPGLEALNSPNFTTELSEYNENYSRQIRESSAINIDRTASWLQAIGGEDEIETVVEARPQPQASLPATPSSARSVRFAPGGQISNIPEEEEVEERDSTFVLGFQHLQNNKNRSDAFIHRKTRTEKLRLDRKCLFTSHVNALEGKYNLCSPPQVITARSDSELAVVEEETSEKIAIATAVRQQSALEQITPVSWNVEATKFLNGGTLLTSPTGKMFGKGANGRLLDLGGVVSCDWAWQVAFEYPKSTVHTVFTADQPSSNSFSSPRNHQQSVVEHLWDLPFPSNHFDCVSARNVYSLLRADEYDRCLKECLRVLRPGGYIEFALLDSDLIRAGRLGAALSAEFSSGLRSRGYNPTPTKTWLRRLRNAGFGQVRRAWLILPMSQVSPTVEGSTADASHITGMVGSWAWERWMQKLQNEMGKDGKPWLESVAGVMEEGAKTGASWRYLSGWARKPL